MSCGLRQSALEITQKFVDDTKYEISVEALAGVELPRAEAELFSPPAGSDHRASRHAPARRPIEGGA
jgi:hypothetical protein